MGSVKDAFNQEYINKLNTVNLRLQNRMKGGYAGNRRSRAKGSSTEFSDFKDYTKGDDVRRIDWNSYARLNRLFIRIFEEEKQANINIFLDASKSMDFGDPNKFTYAKIFAASLVYIASNAADRANIYTIGDKLSLEMKGLSGKGAFPRALDYLDQLEAREETSFFNSFKPATGLSFGGGLIGSGLNVIVSDFFDRAGYEDALKFLRPAAGNTYCLQVLSPQETRPAYTGGIRFVDKESAANLDLDMDETVMGYYLEELNAYNSRLEACCREYGMAYIPADTSAPMMGGLWKMRG